MADFCSCKIQIFGIMDDLKRSGMEMEEVRKTKVPSSYRPSRDRLLTISELVSCTAYHVKVSLDHADVCPEKVSKTDIFHAFWNVARSKPRGISQTMMRALKTAGRRIKDPEIDALFAIQEVHSA